MESEGILAHKYQFKYFKDYLNRTYLNEIIEYGSDGSRFNSTVCGWPNYYHAFSTQSFAVDGKKDIFYFGNVIHEGQEDYIVTERKTTYYSNDEWKLYKGSGLIFEGTVGSGFEKIVLADTDGDGIDNISCLSKRVYPIRIIAILTLAAQFNLQRNPHQIHQRF